MDSTRSQKFRVIIDVTDDFRKLQDSNFFDWFRQMRPLLCTPGISKPFDNLNCYIIRVRVIVAGSEDMRFENLTGGNARYCKVFKRKNYK